MGKHFNNILILRDNIVVKNNKPFTFFVFAPALLLISFLFCFNANLAIAQININNDVISTTSEGNTLNISQISITQRPALVIGSLEINQTWFFVTLILLMSVAFLVGWFGYDNWMDQLGRKVTVAQRDVKNILDNIDKDVDNLLKYFENGTLDSEHLNKMKSTLKNIKGNVEKSRPYIIENMREIEK